MENNQLGIITLVLGELQTNCYVVSCKKTRECVVIDPADSGDTISETILSRQLNLNSIILTHGHFDHVLGLLEVKLNFDVPIMMHHADLFLLKTAKKRASFWLKREVDPIPKPEPADYLSEGDFIYFGKEKLEVLETPGHTPGSIILLNRSYGEGKNHPTLFTGDTLFQNSVGSTDHKYSNTHDLDVSLQRLARFPSATHCYPGHGESFELSEYFG